jgi:hypothetical protein
MDKELIEELISRSERDDPAPLAMISDRTSA